VIKVIWDQSFKRSYKRKVKNNDEYKKKFWDAFEVFIKDPFDPQLKTHKLMEMVNLRACGYLVVYMIVG